MDQAAVIDSLKKHLDSLKAVIGWSLLLAVGFGWTGLTQEQSVEMLGLKVDRDKAFAVAVIFYIFMNAKALDVLLRLEHLMNLLKDEFFMEGISTVALHPFIGNPFSYFGKGRIARQNSAKGYGLLIILWWIAHSSLYTFADGFDVYARVLTFAFLGVGLLSMLAIERFDKYTKIRLDAIDPGFSEELEKMRRVRRWQVFAGIVVGGLIAWFVIQLS